MAGSKKKKSNPIVSYVEKILGYKPAKKKSPAPKMTKKDLESL